MMQNTSSSKRAPRASGPQALIQNILKEANTEMQISEINDALAKLLPDRDIINIKKLVSVTLATQKHIFQRVEGKRGFYTLCAAGVEVTTVISEELETTTEAPVIEMSKIEIPSDTITAHTAYPADFFERQKKHLLELRDNYLGIVQSVSADNLSVEANDSAGVGEHQADAGSDAYEKDFALSLLAKEQDALSEIEKALGRIKDGTYGICEVCNKPIPQIRLEAIPFARLSIECQQDFEKNNKGKRRWENNFFSMEAREADDEEETES